MSLSSCFLKFVQNYGGGRISEAFGGIRHRAFSKYFNWRLLVAPHLLTTEELPLSWMKSSSSSTSSELNSLSRLILLSSGCLTFSIIWADVLFYLTRYLLEVKGGEVVLVNAKELLFAGFWSFLFKLLSKAVILACSASYWLLWSLFGAEIDLLEGSTIEVTTFKLDFASVYLDSVYSLSLGIVPIKELLELLPTFCSVECSIYFFWWCFYVCSTIAGISLLGLTAFLVVT